MKTCRVCGKEKELEEFEKNKRRADGYDNRCLVCGREYKKQKAIEKYGSTYLCSKRYRDSHKDELKQSKHEYYEQNKEVVLDQHKVYYETHKEQMLLQIKGYRERNADRKKQWDKDYVINNREHVQEYKQQYYVEHRDELLIQTRHRNKIRRDTDVWYRVRIGLTRRVLRALCGTPKSNKTMCLIGCSPQELRVHLEAQFQEGMSWSNYGYKGWHIDHIRPCATFDLTDSEQQKMCFHYTNLQPMWALDNMRKGAKWGGPITRIPYQRQTRIGD